ncbi:MAG TPA: histidine phosphatase family protein [Jatrophihabitantaceae bacterium]|jgi:broad specificity phosphatase PhoE|nr:histidine phosphatase family protein [Jatrophihabitantaceae bacterium]
MNTVVHLVRHGEVDNPDRRLYGRMPGYHLSDVGRAMADKAAAFLSGRDLVHLVSSPLERALETAAPIAELTGLAIEQDERLIEAANSFEGHQVAGGKGKELLHPRYWPRYWNPLRPSWGEPYEHIAARVMAAVEDARRAAEDHEAVCVTHQLPIVVATRRGRGERLWHDPRRRRCALGSVTSLVFAGTKIVQVDYAEPAGETPRGAVAGA